MNHAFPPKRPPLRRIAAATAVAVGAALLAAPGNAGAQEDSTADIACAALGENPIAAGLEAALETAAECDVEVRIDTRSTPYATVYATPEGRLHYVGTAAPVQDNLDQGGPDATLTEADGVLVQANTSSQIILSHSDTDAQLLATPQAGIDWAGDQPVPTYSGSTASYGEIAPGLGLTVEAGIAAADLTFTVADATAWDSFDTGLTVPGSGARILQNTIYVPAVTSTGAALEYDLSSPFTVRDNAGTAYRATLALGTGGALTVTVPEAALGDAAFPLTVTTTWTDYSPGTTAWGAITSANPDLSLYRGEAGLDEPYFEAAGANATAVVGDYCDQLADPDCAGTAQASSYWGFMAPRLSDIVPSTATWLNFPVVSGSFRVDAAEGSACVAPDLARASLYLPARSWNYRPTVSGTPVEGVCQDGTAVYDVTPVFVAAWPAALSMAASDETARFDGDSARLDVVLAIRNQKAPTLSCSTSPSGARLTEVDKLTYGGFTAGIWRPDLFDSTFTWAATVENFSTGEVLAATEPEAIVNGTNTSATLTGVADGVYETRYEFVSSDPAMSSVKTCYTLVDTSWPDFVSLEPSPGPYYIGDTVTVGVNVSDAGFPNGATTLNVGCRGGDMCEGIDNIILDDDTTATFEFELEEAFNYVIFDVDDEVGNYDISSSVYFPATSNTYDYNGDRYQDLYLIRKSDGHLLYYPGRGTGTLGTPVDLGSGWSQMDVVMAGDLTEDGVPDLLARDAKTGNLYTYPGNGGGGLQSRRLVGSGWNAISSFTAAGDFNGDGYFDLYALRKSDGKLFFYAGKGDGTFKTRVEVATPTGGNGWGRYDAILTIAPLGNDAQPDLFLRNSENGRNQYVETMGDGTVEDSSSHLGISTKRADGSWAEFTQVAAVGDQDADGREEFIAVDARTGELLLLDGIGYQPTTTVLSKFGGGYEVPAATLDGTYDYDSDGATDLYGIRSSTGDLKFYPGTGTGTFESSQNLGEPLYELTLLETAGDFNGDGIPDLLARTADGTLTMLGGDGDGKFMYTPDVKVGSGWNSMSAIVSGQDFNGDARTDIVAREKSTGYLWLYPGKGDGHVGTRVKIGTGWNSMREITSVGDLDHDGHADLLAIRSSDNCMYLYGGRGNGTVKPGVKMSCNWSGYDQVAAVGDFNGDGHADWVSRRKSDGALYLYKGDGAGGYSSRAQIGTGWNSIKFLA